MIPVFLKLYFGGGGGAWVVQLVKPPNLDFGSGHDLVIMRLNPVLGSVLGVEPA